MRWIGWDSGPLVPLRQLDDRVRRMSMADRGLALGVLAALTLSCYLVFDHMYPLISRFALHRLDFATLDPGHTRVYEVPAIWCALFLLYGLAYWVAPAQPSPRLALLAAAAALAFAVALVFMYPVASNDIYDYIVHARLATHHHANPYLTTPNSYPNDEFYEVSFWKDNASAYGPSWQLIADSLSAWAGNSMVTNLLVFKVAGAGFFAGAMALVWLLLQRLYPANLVRGLILFAWNPLLLFEWIGNGHNDVVLVFWLLLALYLFARKWDTLAWLALAASVLIKFTPVVLVPLFVAGVLLTAGPRQYATRWLTVLVRVLLTILFVLALYLPFGLESLPANIANLQGRGEMFIHSLPAVVYLFIIDRGFDPTESAKAITYLSLLILAVTVGWQLVRLRRTPADERRNFFRPFFAAAFEVFFVLMLVTLWFWPWYVTWLFAFVPFLRQAHRIERAVLFSFSAFGIHWINFLPVAAHPLRESAVGFAIGVVPVIVFTLAMWLLPRWRDRRRYATTPSTA